MRPQRGRNAAFLLWCTALETDSLMPRTAVTTDQGGTVPMDTSTQTAKDGPEQDGAGGHSPALPRGTAVTTLPGATTASAPRNQCPECEEYQLAEGAANATYDYSKATDCRVLLARHRKSSVCKARNSA